MPIPISFPMLTSNQISGVKGAKACITYSAATLSPYKLITYLLTSTLATGAVKLFTHTPVTSITSEPTAGYLIHTPRGIIQTNTIVHATNAYASNLLPEYSSNIIPCKGICCHISIPDKDSPRLPNGKTWG